MRGHVNVRVVVPDLQQEECHVFRYMRMGNVVSVEDVLLLL